MGRNYFLKIMFLLVLSILTIPFMTQEAKAFTITDDGEYAVVLKTGEGEIDGTYGKVIKFNFDENEKSIKVSDITKGIIPYNGETAFAGWTMTRNDTIDKIQNYNIELHNISFGYENRPIIQNVTLKIPEHRVTAIVGPSGSGKTTLCNLITRFWDVQQGEIMIGGKNIKEIEFEELMKLMSIVFQKVYLFHDTIENNIKFGKPTVTHEEVVEAARRACCHEFIEKLPNGYQTIIGEGGSTLSGGEKQRISIARAILKDAPIIILDEATSSVDPENQHALLTAINELTCGKTLIIIAHRLSTIKDADQIIVLDNGHVVQQGTHETLLQQDGIYRRFVKIRQTASSWKI